MPKFNFKFETTLSIKEKMEAQKKNELGFEMKKLENEKNKLLEIIALREESEESIRNMLNGFISTTELQNTNVYISKIENDISIQETNINKQENIVKKKQEELVKAMTEKKAFEKLKENAFEEYMIESKISEQKQIDELVSYKYSSR